mgnify:CR=1 FL=1
MTLNQETNSNQFLKDDLKDTEKMVETLKETLKEFTLKKESGDPFYSYDETYEKARIHSNASCRCLVSSESEPCNVI